MRDFFHGWERKLGQVTLTLALVTFGLWMRSRVVHEALSFGLGHHQQAVISFHGRISWWSYDLLSSETPYNHWGARTFSPAEVQQISETIETTRMLLVDNNHLFVLSAPYWCLVLPLTLLSAYLLLSPSRKRPAASQSTA